MITILKFSIKRKLCVGLCTPVLAVIPNRIAVLISIAAREVGYLQYNTNLIKCLIYNIQKKSENG